MGNLDETIKKFRVKNPVLLGMSILLLLVGIWVNIKWISSKPSWMLYFINFLPGLVLLACWEFAGRYANRRRIFIIGGIFFTIIASMFAYIFNAGAAIVTSASTPIENISEYSGIMSQKNDWQMISHFPKAIPEQATNAKLYFLPGFLQGGNIIQLRLTMPPDDILELLAYFRADAQYIVMGGDSADYYDEDYPDDIFMPSYHTNESGEFTFPETFEIIILESQPLGTPDFEWNHGYSYGVAIDVENSIIVYWAEDW